MRKIRNFTLNLTVLGIVMLLIFFSFEVSLRIFYPQSTTLKAERISIEVFEKSDYTPWKLKPNSYDRQISATGREYDVSVKINSDGLRDNELSIEELQTKTVLGAIGDSFTFGYGVELEDTFHKKLERTLNSDSNKFRVINMGRADGSMTTDVQYLYLKNKGLKFNPKIMIVGYYAGNDITDIGTKTTWLDMDENGNPTNITSTYTYVDKEGRLRRNYNTSTERESIFYKLNRFMSTWSHTHIFMKKLFIGAFLVEPEPNHVREHPNSYLDKFDISMQMLLEIDKMLKANNGTLVVMLIPAKVQIDDKAWKSYEKFFGRNSFRLNPQKEIMEFCNKKNLKCLDLLPNFIGKSELYFKIDGHWNEEGHKLAAIELYGYLINGDLI